MKERLSFFEPFQPVDIASGQLLSLHVFIVSTIGRFLLHSVFRTVFESACLSCFISGAGLLKRDCETQLVSYLFLTLKQGKSKSSQNNGRLLNGIFCGN